NFGSVLNSGARLYEPQHSPMQSKPLRVADPRSAANQDTTLSHSTLTLFLRFGKAMVAVALVLTLGGHWALLQTMAWTTMLAGNLQSRSLHEAVTQTF